MITASAPGKIILFGEHVVVYGRPALAVPVLKVQTQVEISDTSSGEIWVDAPNIQVKSRLTDLPRTDALRCVIEDVFTALEITDHPSLNIHIESSIPVASGLGSGAAVSVALIRALSSTVKRLLSTVETNKLAYEIEKLHHGNPSGIDNTVITYAQPVYFMRGQPIEQFYVKKAFTLVIGNTGDSAPTKESVGAVYKLWQSDKKYWDRVFDDAGNIVEDARNAIRAGEIAALGPLMDANHQILQALTVSSPKLDKLVNAAKIAGAIGAKLSGGGRGGNMIALVDPQTAEQVVAALHAAGATSTIITSIPESKIPE